MLVVSNVGRRCRGIVTAVVLVVGLATLLGLLDRVFWVFEIADVFRMQYLVLLLAAALAALMLRRSKLAFVAVGKVTPSKAGWWPLSEPADSSNGTLDLR